MPQIALSELPSRLSRRMRELMQVQVRRGLRRAAERARKLLIERSPVGLGQYRQAWSAPRALPNGEVGFEVRNDAPHAWMVEHGSAPHMPPVEPIALWAKRKFGLTEKEALSVAWAVAKTIEKRGTPPHHVALGAEAEIRILVEQEVRRALRERDQE